ncbi:MAG: hypothetical protein QM731_00290 [Chitinophagaceae bacterium]
MLTTKEKRFLKYWEEQRQGGRWSYYALYIFGGTFVATIVIYLVWSMLAPYPIGQLWLIPASGAVIMAAITHFSWQNNEKRFRMIIRREINDGKLRDEQDVKNPNV